MKLIRAWLVICGFFVLPLGAFAQYTLTYSTNGSVITLKGYTGTPVTVTVPSFVTSIGVNALREASSLMSITIGTNVTSIGEEAFYECYGLTNAMIDADASIGIDAFYRCTNLASLTFGASVAGIGSDAFYACAKLVNIVLPSSVTNIGNDAFYECYGLTNAMIDASASLGIDAFYRCTNLASLTFGASVTGIGGDAFYECAKLANIVLPNNVTNIGASAFYECYGLTNAMIDASASVGIDAFYRCTNLASLTFGANVTGIGSDAFYGCAKLANIVLSNNVTNIGVNAFYDCYGLTNATIDASASLGNDAFYRCTNLASLTFGASVTGLGGGAFAQDVKLTSITIPESVTSIGPSAFLNCALTTVTIPASVISIGDEAFNESGSLTAINVDPGNPAYYSANGVLFNKSLTSLIEYPDGLSGGYSIPDSVTNIDGYSFYGCLINAVTIPEGVISIGDDAFSRTALATVMIPGSVTNLGVTPFDECEKLTTISVAANNFAYSAVNGVLFDENQAALIEYPAGSAATSYTAPASVTSISDDAFDLSLTLTDVTLGIDVTNLGEDAFYDCDHLEGVYFSGNAPTADSTAFYNDDNGTNDPASAYYLPGTSGWGDFSTNTGIPAELLNGPNPSGTLQVTIEPAGAVNAGAQWQVDGGFLQIGGATVYGLSVGSHLVNFTTTSLWTKPANQLVTIISNSLSTATGTYGEQFGSLQVTIVPAGAVMSGAEWQLDGTNEISGEPVTNLAAGSHQIAFTAASGWRTPSNQTVTIINGVSATTSGIYTSSNTPASGLTLLTNGFGSITHGAWPTTLKTGIKYTVVAKPMAGNVFVDWVGGTAQPYSVLSESASYKFTNEPNMVLEANFITNVFLAAQGTFRGLFAPDATRQQENSGSFEVSVTKTAEASGSVDLGGQSASFSGKFGLDGTRTFVTKATGKIPSLTVALALDFADQSVSGTVSNEAFSAALYGDLDVFGHSRPATNFEGHYTLIIPGTADSLAGPYGISYGTAKVSALGVVTFTGSLADGTTISQSSVVSKDGYWPLYVNLYGGKGSLWGWNFLTNRAIASAPALSWLNGGNTARGTVYHSGFTNQEATVSGGLYDSTTELPADMTAIVEGGNPPFAITNGVTIAGNDKVALTNSMDETNKLILKITKSAGVITGSFANPSKLNQMIKVNGVILQGQTNAQGYFLEGDQSGTFLLENP